MIGATRISHKKRILKSRLIFKFMAVTGTKNRSYQRQFYLPKILFL
jgi:hypothetical protein